MYLALRVNYKLSSGVPCVVTRRMLYEGPELMAEIVDFENSWRDEQRGQTGRDSAVATTALGRCELLLPHCGLGRARYFDTRRVLPEQTVSMAVVSKWAVRYY
jgi:hypothetical protein